MQVSLNLTGVDVQNEELRLSSEYLLVSLVWSGSISELSLVILSSSFELHIMVLVIFVLIILIRYAISLAVLLFMLEGLL